MLGYLLLAVFAVGAGAYVFYPPFRVKVDGLKTMLTAVAVAGLGVLQTADLTTIFSNPKMAGVAVIAIGVLMAALRVITSGPPAGLR